MTAVGWETIGSILAIITFLATGLGFAYRGFKKWKRAETTEESKVRWGKFEFGLGIAFFVAAVIVICVLISLLGDHSEDNTSSPSPSIESANVTPPIESEAAKTYVAGLLFHGATYSGYVNEDRQPDGKGTMTYSDGSEYTGDWENGIRQGKGTMKYSNGTYDGEWENDKKNGEGTYVWNDGKTYEGAYVNDVRSGEGIFSGWIDLTNGYSGTYYGESQNDQFNGYGSFLFDNGDKFEGTYKENLYWTGTYTRKDGSTYSIVNGKPQ